MGIRLTGFSTPVVGATWEYTEDKNEMRMFQVIPERKINVFISSICGIERYDNVRKELKEALESTKLVDVYTFEGKGASTLPAGAHYTWALEDCDVCIFLIDNEDGINPGVQIEIDTVNKRNIKALYYFCDETVQEKTPLEKSLMGAKFAKSKIIHKFEELSQNGAQDLINDIITVYHYYCTNKIAKQLDDDEEFQRLNVTDIDKIQTPIVPKTILKNIDKSKDYILKYVIGYTSARFQDEEEKTNEIDEWGRQFLSILFEGKSIRQFNVGMYLDVLRGQQTDDYHQIVRIRWDAIQAYYLGDVSKCIEYLESALKRSKETKQPIWVIKDILIDLRNLYLVYNTMNNCYSQSEAQKELMESGEEVYYPTLDRIYESLQEKYIKGLYKKKTDSPYSVTIEGNLDQLGGLLTSAYIVAIYNASLTHLLLFYDKIKDFLFYLSSKYEDWTFRRDLLKFTIRKGKHKEVKGIIDSYPEVLNNLSSKDAEEIMNFCNTHPIKHERFISHLVAFGAIGYYLENESFKKYEQIVVRNIKEWLNDEKSVFDVGYSIFKGLSGVAYRMSQDLLAEICCMFIDKHYVRWYIDIFRFIEKCIDINVMSEDSAKKLVEHIISIFEREKEREEIRYAPYFLCVLRKQNTCLTEVLDRNVEKYLPNYYNEDYKLETNEEQNLTEFISKYIKNINENNEKQGKNGAFYGRRICEISRIRYLLVEKEVALDSGLKDSIIFAVADTLLISKESITTKMNAISLLSCIAIKYPEDYERNKNIYQTLVEKKEEIEVDNHLSVFTNIDSISLKIGLCFLYAAMDIDTYSDILELMPYIQNDVATTNIVANFIVEYLEVTDAVRLPKRIEMVVLQNVLQWLQSEYVDLRWNATRILFALFRNPENRVILNNQLLKLVDSDGVYIKNLIMRHLHKVEGIDEATKEYIIMKCENDANYVVRMVCEEERSKNA